MSNEETTRGPGSQRTEREALFQAIFEEHPESLTVLRPVFDDDGHCIDAEILDLNQVSADRHADGAPRALVRGQRLFDAMPQLPPITFDLIAAVAETRATQHQEVSWGAPGAPRWSEVTVFPFDGGLVMLGRDVTARHEAQASLEASEARYRAAAAEMARLAAAIEQTSESVVITDVEGSITYVNPAFERVSGYSRSEAIGQNPRVLKSGRQSDAFYVEMWETLVSGATWQGELVNRRRDGSLYTEVAAISPIRDGSGTTTAYVAVKRDVTTERSMEAQMRQAQRLEAIGQLAGGVAHDFNNLLAAIIGYAEMAREALPAGSEPRSDIEEALLVAGRAATLTRQLLAFSRRQPLAPTIVDPVKVIEETRPMLQRLVGPQVELVTTGTPGTLSVRVDQGQLEQVVANLAVNARDAMPQGGRLSISVSAARLTPAEAAESPDFAGLESPEVVRIVVADTGCGMDPTTLARAFEPFFSTKEPGKGTGMGLASVHGIVHQSHGRILATSDPGTGTTFTIDLPRVLSDTTAALPVGPEGEQPAPATLPEGPQRILLVEDEPVLRSFLARTLEGAGFKVQQSGSGDHALEVWNEGRLPIDLLITDVGMPGIQGHELGWRMRVVRPDLPILFISGFATGPELNAARRIGTATLVKPFETAVFLETVRRILAQPTEG